MISGNKLLNTLLSRIRENPVTEILDSRQYGKTTPAGLLTGSISEI